MPQAVSNERTPLLSNDINNVERQLHSGDPSAPLRKSTPTPKLPMKPLIVLITLNAMQPLVFELVFPFISALPSFNFTSYFSYLIHPDQMLVETGVVEDPEAVGFYSGLIESCYALMSFVASMSVSFHLNRCL